MIGLTMGLTVWGSTNLIAGWISGRYEVSMYIDDIIMNSLGLLLIRTLAALN